MLTKRKLLAALLCGGMAISGGLTGTAAAAGGTLQPNSDWAVSKLAAAQSGGNPYCALARRFSNNLILTLARNSQDESSLAIDFQETALNNTQSYHVKVSPGFGQDRAFNVRPVSGKALVIRLGQDYAFHDALNRSGSLAVNISGEDYKFNLPDFSDGQKKLSECLVTLVEPAAGGAPVAARNTAAMTPPPPSVNARSSASVSTPLMTSSNTVISSPSKTKVDTAAVQELREENMRLRNALERERRIYEDRLLQESAGSSVAAELNEKVRILEMENGQLQQQLAYKPAPADVSCPMPDTSAQQAMAMEIETLRGENMALQQDIERQRAQYTQLEAELAQARQQSETMAATQTDTQTSAQINAQQIAASQARTEAENAIAATLRERVKRLEEENKALKSASVQSASGIEGSVSLAQLRSIEEQLRFVQDDRDRLLAQIENRVEGKQSGLLDISSDNWNLEQATRRFNEAEREIRRLGRQLEEQRTQCAMQKKELEYMLFDPEVAEQEQISRLLKLETENSAYQDQLSMVELEKSEYEQKLVMMEQELASIENTAVDVSAYEQKITALESNLASIEAAAGAVSIDEKALAQLELENAALREESQNLALYKQSLSQDKQALVQEKQALAERTKTLVSEKEALVQQIAALETALAQIPTGAGTAATSYAPPPSVEAQPVGLQARSSYDSAVGYEAQEVSYAQDYTGDYQNTPPAAPAAVSAASVKNVAYTAQTSSVDTITATALQAILTSARIPLQSAVELVDADPQGFASFSWDAGGLYGSAEQQPMGDLSRFDDYVRAYLEKTKSRCQGDFASVPISAEQAGSIRVSSYEIACVSGQGGASASIVFFNDGNAFTAIAHESGLENMDSAMDARENLTTLLLQSS